MTAVWVLSEESPFDDPEESGGVSAAFLRRRKPRSLH